MKDVGMSKPKKHADKIGIIITQLVDIQDPKLNEQLPYNPT